MSLKSDAADVLPSLRIELSDPLPYESGDLAWHRFQHAFVNVVIENTCGLPLRNLSTDVITWYGIGISPYEYVDAFGVRHTLCDGKETFPELEPGDIAEFSFRLFSYGAYGTRYALRLWAEVVPYSAAVSWKTANVIF